jgi:hypothetical protein
MKKSVQQKNLSYKINRTDEKLKRVAMLGVEDFYFFALGLRCCFISPMEFFLNCFFHSQKKIPEKYMENCEL